MSHARISTNILERTSAELPAQPAVILRNVAKTFPGGIAAVVALSLTIPKAEFLAILGPSGCGKSTLLRMIAGLETPTAGIIEQPHPRVAFVFQDSHLLPWRSVLRNVALPLELRGEARQRCEDQAKLSIDQVGLTDFTHRYPAELSGGMRMRVSLARALVTNPDLLLLDEPFAALDEITRTELDEQLRQLWIARKMTVVFVTHSIGEAAFLANRAVVLSARPAKIALDTNIELGLQRVNALRGEPAYAEVTQRLLLALEAGASRP